jgi:hypothetical protein
MGKKSDLAAERQAAAIERNRLFVDDLFNAGPARFPCPGCQSYRRIKPAAGSADEAAAAESSAGLTNEQKDDPRTFTAVCGQCGRIAVVAPILPPEHRAGKLIIAVERAKVDGKFASSFHMVVPMHGAALRS